VCEWNACFNRIFLSASTSNNTITAPDVLIYEMCVSVYISVCIPRQGLLFHSVVGTSFNHATGPNFTFAG